jgi:hypothetical protein
VEPFRGLVCCFAGCRFADLALADLGLTAFAVTFCDRTLAGLQSVLQFFELFPEFLFCSLRLPEEGSLGSWFDFSHCLTSWSQRNESLVIAFCLSGDRKTRTHH